MRWLAFLCFFCLCGCRHHVLYVQKEFLGPERYASVYVGSPDPKRFCPEVGERFYVHWSLPRRYTDCYPLELAIFFRYPFGDEDSWVVPITARKGWYELENIGDWFCAKGGVRSYLVQLIKDGVLLAEERHVLWEDRIVIEEIEDLEDDEYTFDHGE